MIEFDLYTFAVIASAVVGVIALIGGIIWYLPKHILGRKERELDKLENSHFRIVLVKHLNEILYSVLMHFRDLSYFESVYANRGLEPLICLQ